jgi:glycosyltransferase involved in cell wall biosynthesis
MSTSVTIFHNVVWSRHKGMVFSALHDLAGASAIHYTVIQIADTEHHRLGFSDVDYSFHRYPMKKLFDGCYEDVPRWRMTTRLVWEVLQAKSELVVLPGYHRPEYWAMLLACMVTGKRRAVFCDSTARDQPRRLLTSIPKRIFFSLCDGYFGFGKRSREYLISLGAKQERIFIPCQAAALPASFVPEQALANRLAARADGAPVFLYVGRLTPEKGVGLLIDAFAALRARLPQARLRLVGSGPLREALEHRVATLGMSAAVLFLGSLQDEPLSREYFSASCLVVPSEREPWGLVVNEALSHGCPVVVSENCGCVPELVVNGVTGYAFATGNAAQLQRAMLKVVDEFADTARVGQRCMDLIKRFDPLAAASQIARGCARLLVA